MTQSQQSGKVASVEYSHKGVTASVGHQCWLAAAVSGPYSAPASLSRLAANYNKCTSLQQGSVSDYVTVTLLITVNLVDGLPDSSKQIRYNQEEMCH